MSVALAEPRRKEKYGPDPRNTFWSNDESKFGFRMLQSMGWKKGKGLGAKETGMTENLKAGSRKNTDIRGFGCSKKDADKWIAHQDDFESILASLNESAHPSDTSSCQPSESTKASHAMEEKSRSSRSRVHYHKFIQSKDLSTRSAADLNCIFGRRKKPSEKSAENAAATTSSEANGDDSSSSDDQKNVTEDVPTHGVKTIISSCSVQEYFAMKMAQLQRKMRPDADVPTESNCNDSETTPNHCNKNKSEPDGADVSVSEDSGLTEKQKRKKKKKKHRLENQENEVRHEDPVPEKSGDSCAESCQDPNPVCVDEQQSSKSEKKEKRKKKKGSSERESENGSQPSSAEEPEEAEVSHEAEPTAKKAKKRKSAELNASAAEQENTCELNQNGVCEDSDEATQKKKKKKKKQKKEEEEEKEDTHNSSILRQEKDGKNRRRKSVRFSTGTAEIFMIPNKEDEKAEQEEEKAVSKKLSKKRKRQKANAEEETETDSQTTTESAQEEDGDESLTEEDLFPKKKKRKTEKASKKKSKAQKENQEKPPEESAESELPQSALTSGSVDTVKEGGQTESENPASVGVPQWKGPKSSKKDMSQEQVDRISKSFIGANLSSVKGYGNWS